ncbi:NAD(P)-dependent oxidoreductase [Thiohalocapsa marina]|uniref:NAD(P)-dependent oxidoreductase n=1 Tax=Thiohalocapsa marina TaxID=424902 RepID=A0A5M8FGL9_9GAMM|nr:NAD(P)-dependent oxidoreductase [Thiohalocapsa marina]KAA6182916.1 NAD(P)-dependent oxidoreductase [Thiohalocapsa marina]
MRLAILGTGLLGREIALRLQDHRFDVRVWNRTADKAAPLAAAGIPLAPDPAAAIADADLILLLLADAAAINATLFPDAAAAPDLSGRIILQMGTIAPNESRSLAAHVARAGGEYLEAPVLGSLPEARKGHLIVMAGGELDLFQRCLPVLEALSRAPQRVGEVGQGAALKLAMNQLIAGLTASFALSLGLVRAEGIDVEQFMGLLRQSALYAPTFDKKLDKYLGHAYDGANFPLKHLLKDVALFRRVADDAGLDAATLAALQAALERAVAAGLGEADYSALYESLTRDLAGDLSRGDRG